MNLLAGGLILKSKNNYMREIKFRGKRVDNGEWVYGHYLLSGKEHHANIRHMIAIDEGSCVRYAGLDFYEVIPETVGQYTGLKDKDGKEIYEGDLIDYGNNRFMPVEFINGCFCICKNTAMPTLMTLFPIIGNIHDNPELITR